jgi:Tol biopolymer transport system component
VLDRIGSPEHVAGLALSPEGDRVLIARHTPQNTADQDLWLYELTRGANPRRLTSAPTLEFLPVWRTNDAFIYASGGGETGIYQQTVGRERELLFDSGIWDVPTSVTPDGRVTLYSSLRDQTMRSDVWVYTTKSGSDGSPVIRRQFDQGQAQLSPDRRWIAYVSNETARNEVFVAAFRLDEAADRTSISDSVLVSKGGGSESSAKDGS